MSGCSNDISSVLQGNPRNGEKCLRIVRAYLKDFLQYVNISYCSALFNLSDVGTKNRPNLQIWRRFLRFGSFYAGRMSRKECKTIASQVKFGGFCTAHDYSGWWMVLGCCPWGPEYVIKLFRAFLSTLNWLARLCLWLILSVGFYLVWVLAPLSIYALLWCLIRRCCDVPL